MNQLLTEMDGFESNKVPRGGRIAAIRRARQKWQGRTGGRAAWGIGKGNELSIYIYGVWW